MKKYNDQPIKKSERIGRLVDHLFAKMPEIEADRAVLLTEAYQQTEGEPMVTRRAKAFLHICKNLPIVIRPEELVVGSATKSPRGCPTFPEFSYQWLENEFDTIEKRSADPFHISEQSKAALRAIHPYWKGKTTSELASAYMAPETRMAIEHNIFTPGNYFYNGVGHVTVNYGKVLAVGFSGIRQEAEKALAMCSFADADYNRKSHFLNAVITSCNAIILYARRYAALALEEAKKESDPTRKQELLQIAQNCANVPEKGATTFWEACQSFWFVQLLLQVESSGHSISPGRFDQYMYPYYEKDVEEGRISRESVQELIDCVWVKLNDMCKVRDSASAEGFAGYSMFQNLIVGGQSSEGEDVTNDLSFMCIEASRHVFLPQPSLSIRVWNKSPHELLIKAAELTRTGIGLPAYYNDEVIIPALISRGLTMADAREYNIIGCVEPQKSGKTDGWHDAAFFNMCRPLELVFSNGYDKGKLISIQTGNVTEMETFEEFYDAYKAQMDYMISLMVNADNAIDLAHMERCPLPFLSSMIEDCIGRGKSVQEGGAIYNFTGPQGFGVANMADSLYAVKKLVYEEKKLTMAELKAALEQNFGKKVSAGDVEELTRDVINGLKAKGQKVSDVEAGQIASLVMNSMKQDPSDRGNYERVREMLEAQPKFGNDIPEVDMLARDVAYTYARPVEKYTNPRGGRYQAGLYPVSANVPLGAQTGATPDGRYAGTPVADGVSPSAGKDRKGPTAAANSVSKLDHYIASNGTLYNQKFHPSALAGRQGLENFVALIRAYFDQKGSHVQFNVVDRETLLDAQKNPEKYKGLVVRVAGYSALFTTLSKSLQDDIIRRTEQGF
ncbi:MAG: glycyl radical protein [Lachnospiraceae bacterium]|nr:glycyl radical protein [Lachnospiraceae bacterium]